MAVSFCQRVQSNCEWIALLFLTLCFMVSAVSVTLTVVTYLLAFLFTLLACDWRSRFQKIKHNPAAWSFWLIGALYIIGIFYSTSETHLMLQDLRKNHWLLITPFFIAIIVSDLWRHRMLNLFLGVMVLTLFLSYLKGILPIEWVHRVRWPDQSVYSVFVNHIVQSFAMNIAAFLCGYRFLFEKKWRLAYAFIFLLMAVNIIFMSEGRTGYGIFFVLLLYLGLLRFGWKGLLLATVTSVLLVSAAFFLSDSFRTRMTAMYVQYEDYHQIHHHTSVGQRIEMVQIAKEMIAKRPWFGYGTGGIRTALPSVVPAKDRVWNPSLDYVESIYLNFLLEFGFFGLVIFLIVMGMQLRISFQLPFLYRALFQFLLVTILFGGFFNAFLVSFPIAHLYSLFSAVCFSAYQTKGSRCSGITSKIF